MNDLDSVVISGAGQGIGKAVALELGRCGIDVLCVSETTNCEVTASESFCAAF
jgi:NAD(P)-dependent dehydrogenase (short-subunit alcohol dehydrogenase family)